MPKRLADSLRGAKQFSYRDALGSSPSRVRVPASRAWRVMSAIGASAPRVAILRDFPGVVESPDTLPVGSARVRARSLQIACSMAKRAISSSGDRDLHGNAPDRANVALLLIDLINDLDFPGGEHLTQPALAAAKKLATLKQRAVEAGVPCIYVNDNFGRWRSDFTSQVRHCLDGTRGRHVCALLRPSHADYFVLKPKHSGFYETCLDLLLAHLGAKVLLLAGLATENCVNFTANDAFLRGYQLVLVEDGCASQSPQRHRQALAEMKRLLHARRAKSSDIGFVRQGGGVSVRIAQRAKRR